MTEIFKRRLCHQAEDKELIISAETPLLFSSWICSLIYSDSPQPPLPGKDCANVEVHLPFRVIRVLAAY